jgi:hypothetical protein
VKGLASLATVDPLVTRTAVVVCATFAEIAYGVRTLLGKVVTQEAERSAASPASECTGLRGLVPPTSGAPSPFAPFAFPPPAAVPAARTAGGASGSTRPIPGGPARARRRQPTSSRARSGRAGVWAS